ncbi:MAG: hypothetical protein ACRDXX_17125 [Stackebrandtia sp.]
MKRIALRGAAALTAAAVAVAVAAPALAAETEAADPALVSCSFAGVYDSFDGEGAGLQGYAKRDDNLTVTEGNGDAWKVHVEDGFMAGADGWIESDCVAFLG